MPATACLLQCGALDNLSLALWPRRELVNDALLRVLPFSCVALGARETERAHSLPRHAEAPALSATGHGAAEVSPKYNICLTGNGGFRTAGVEGGDLI